MKLTDAELDIVRRAKAAYDKDPVTTLFSPMWIEMLCDAADEIAALRAEVERYKQWVDDLQSGMYVNCVYCGHRYGPGETTPVSMADTLKQHVENCPKHPMSALKVQIAALRAENEELKAENERMWYELYDRDAWRRRAECLESRLASMTAERDALIASLRNNDKCETCMHSLSDGCSAIRNGWRCRYVHPSEEWRGPEVEKE